ncbi:MAG: 8-amino-7-oxononanoate synthase [Treponema sp.]|jgi:glycine C-acetyltransferase|nr:8-amino-7-oxononanoate synthase [Treponema sp.]
MLEERLARELAELRAKERGREVADLCFEGPVTARDRAGGEYLVFSSNNYLGLTHADKVVDAAKKALAFGTGSGGSRLITGASFAASDLERELAAFTRAERALIFNTGYMANLGALYALAGKDDVIFSDELNHASIIDGCRISRARTLVYKHNDLEDLERLLKETGRAGQRFIVSDGVFSMDGDLADLPGLVVLKERYDAFLIIDDAHGAGVLGGDGSGTAAHYGLTGGVDLHIGTLSKALASEGGFAAGSGTVIEYLINKSRPFIFSTALSAPSLAAAGAALSLLREDPAYLRRLRENIALARALLREGGVNVPEGITPIIPIIIGGAGRTTLAAAALRRRGVLVSGIRPPTVRDGTCRLRFTLSAAHTEEQIRRAAAALSEVVGC